MARREGRGPEKPGGADWTREALGGARGGAPDPGGAKPWQRGGLCPRNGQGDLAGITSPSIFPGQKGRGRREKAGIPGVVVSRAGGARPDKGLRVVDGFSPHSPLGPGNLKCCEALEGTRCGGAVGPGAREGLFFCFACCGERSEAPSVITVLGFLASHLKTRRRKPCNAI